MSIHAQLEALPTLGSINVVIRPGAYTFYAVRGLPKVTTIEVSAPTFEEAAIKLIERFGA